MPLSQLQVIHVCKKSEGFDTCRYLSEDVIKLGAYQCLKLTGQKKIIDDAVEGYLSGSKNDGSSMPISDNCKGYPVLHHAVVGYDQNKS